MTLQDCFQDGHGPEERGVSPTPCPHAQNRRSKLFNEFINSSVLLTGLDKGQEAYDVGDRVDSREDEEIIRQEFF